MPRSEGSTILVQPMSLAGDPTHDVRRLRTGSYLSAYLWLTETSCSLSVKEPENEVPIEFKWSSPFANGPITSETETELYEYKLEARVFRVDLRSLFFGWISRKLKTEPCIGGEDADTFVAVSVKPGGDYPPSI